VNAKPYLLAFAIILLRPHMGHAQPSSGVVHEYRVPDSEIPSRPPPSGFRFGVRPGPGNAYGYPDVREVVSGSAADAAGLEVGDVIVAVDGRDMRYEDFFPVKVAGTRYVMLVRRGEEELELLYTYPQVESSPRRETPAAAPPE
jgi:membrane-associated protease RseP (regulator of RpoE activity)